jgi:hypothetical protein
MTADARVDARVEDGAQDRARRQVDDGHDVVDVAVVLDAEPGVDLEQFDALHPPRRVLLLEVALLLQIRALNLEVVLDDLHLRRVVGWQERFLPLRPRLRMMNTGVSC